jgi:hypothetical protein
MISEPGAIRFRGEVLGCDRSLDATDVFEGSLLRMSLTEERVPKPPTGRISLLDGGSTKWDDDLL